MAPSMKAVCALYGDCSGLFARPFSVRVAMKLLGNETIEIDAFTATACLEPNGGTKLPCNRQVVFRLNLNPH